MNSKVLNVKVIFAHSSKNQDINDQQVRGIGMNQAEKRILLIITAIILAFLCIYFTAGILFSKATRGRPSLDKLESFSGIHFPQNTRLINGYFEGLQDPQFMAILEFDAEETDAFLQSISQKNQYTETVKLSRKDRFGITNKQSIIKEFEAPDWWDPDSVQRFIAVERIGHSQKYLLISMDDDTKRKVYLILVTS